MELQEQKTGLDNLSYDPETGQGAPDNEEKEKNFSEISLDIPESPDNEEPKLEKEKETVEEDPWDATNLKPHGKPWDELDCAGKFKRVFWDYIMRIVFLLILLYMFICSLDFLSSAFRLLGGRSAGQVFANNELLNNPIAGVMAGVLATVLVQSSSTSTSIVITMVGAGLLKAHTAVPIIMGANIGTSMTNTIVSMAHITDQNNFRRAFGGATVHDMFNWLSVLILLPIEMGTGYLYKVSTLIVETMDLTTYKEGKQELLKTITKPFTQLVIAIDTKKITAIATGDDEKAAGSLIKIWKKFEDVSTTVNKTFMEAVETRAGVTTMVPVVKEVTEVTQVGVEKYTFMFMDVAGVWPDETIGAIMLVIALFILCLCLVLIVRLLHLLLRGQVALALKKFINADFPGWARHFTGYLAILIGAGLTFLVQSSSIFTSAITPLVGVGVLKIDRMYPLTLGANIGTTTTGLLAALATSGVELPHALTVALCHLFFNISGILIWYPIPYLRVIPIKMAKFLGNETAKYRWFALLYLLFVFLILPAAIFGLSLISWIADAIAVCVVLVIVLLILFVKLLQKKRPQCLPKWLRNWKFLPVFMRSLAPYDRVIQKLLCCNKCKHQKT